MKKRREMVWKRNGTCFYRFVIYGCTSSPASGNRFPEGTIVPKFSLSVLKPANPFPLMFVFRCLLKKKDKYTPAVSFVHVDNTLARDHKWAERWFANASGRMFDRVERPRFAVKSEWFLNRRKFIWRIVYLLLSTNKIFLYTSSHCSFIFVTLLLFLFFNCTFYLKKNRTLFRYFISKTITLCHRMFETANKYIKQWLFKLQIQWKYQNKFIRMKKQTRFRWYQIPS